MRLGLHSQVKGVCELLGDSKTRPLLFSPLDHLAHLTLLFFLSLPRSPIPVPSVVCPTPPFRPEAALLFPCSLPGHCYPTSSCRLLLTCPLCRGPVRAQQEEPHEVFKKKGHSRCKS